MTKGSNRTLRKKLQELDAELHFFYTQSLQIDDSYRYLLASEIKQHFLFVKNLLKAEIESDPTNTQSLNRISRRLSKIEATFRNRELSSPVKNIDYVDDSSVSSSETSDDDDGKDDDACSDGKLETTKKRKGFVFEMVRFCGVFMSGVIFGITILSVSMGIVELSDPFISTAASQGFLIPT